MGVVVDAPMSPDMKDSVSHDEALRAAPPIRICLMGLLVFAFERGDRALADAIDTMMDEPPAPLGRDNPFDRRLADALAQEVDEIELIWWRKAQQLARGCGRARAIYHQLARLRVGSDGPM
jgi:hypothetical protein